MNIGIFWSHYGYDRSFFSLLCEHSIGEHKQAVTLPRAREYRDFKAPKLALIIAIIH